MDSHPETIISYISVHANQFHLQLQLQVISDMVYYEIH